MLTINIIFFTFVVFSLLGICHLFINLKLKDVSKFVLGLTLFFGLSFFIFLIVQYINLVGNPFVFEGKTDSQTDNIRSGLGALGDYFGGLLNPILAFLSFIALLYTLNLNQKELAETRKELARAAQAHEDSKKVMEEQLKTQALQQFDSLFFNLLDKFDHKIMDLDEKGVLNDFCILFDQPFQVSSLSNQEKQLQVIKLLFEILNILKIKFHETKDIINDGEENLREHYRNVLLCLIPQKVLHLVLRHNFSYKSQINNQRDKVLVEHFSLFEKLILNGDMHPVMHSFILRQILEFDQTAFLNNSYYQVFRENNIFKLFQTLNASETMMDIPTVLHKLFRQCFRHYAQKDDLNLFAIPIDIREKNKKMTKILLIKFVESEEDGWYEELYLCNKPLKEYIIRSDDSIDLIFTGKIEESAHKVEKITIQYSNDKLCLTKI